MNYISEKLQNSGFKEDEITKARSKAMNLNRSEILSPDKKRKAAKEENSKTLTFMINRNDFMAKKLKEVLNECHPDIERLLGKTKVMVAERKNCSIGSAVFAKSAFSRETVHPKKNQKCNGKGCKTCKIMNLSKTFNVWKNCPGYQKEVKLDFRSNCSTECIIYIYFCNICKNNESLYVGQSVNDCKTRANGHRANFTDELYKKSALSLHIYKDHPDYINKKLLNYSLGVIKSTAGVNLDRAEDYYVESLRADLSLNRYKVTT